MSKNRNGAAVPSAKRRSSPYKDAVLRWLPPGRPLSHLFLALEMDQGNGRRMLTGRRRPMEVTRLVEIADALGAPRTHFLVTVLQEMERSKAVPKAPRPTLRRPLKRPRALLDGWYPREEK